MFPLCLVCLALLAATGCSIPAKLTGTWITVSPAPSGGQTAVVNGDWDDVYAASLVSTDIVEGAILGRDTGTSDTGAPWVRLRLLTIDDEQGELLAERLGDSDSTVPIRLTARIGWMGDEPREARLVRAVGDRLRELAGRDWAPVK